MSMRLPSYGDEDTESIISSLIVQLQAAGELLKALECPAMADECFKVVKKARTSQRSEIERLQTRLDRGDHS